MKGFILHKYELFVLTLALDICILSVRKLTRSGSFQSTGCSIVRRLELIYFSLRSSEEAVHGKSYSHVGG